MSSALLPPPAPEGIFGYMPDETENFAVGVYQLIKQAICYLLPGLSNTLGLCFRIFAVMMILAILNSLNENRNINMIGAAAVTALLIGPFQELISEGIESAQQICDYGKLMLPVMSVGLASQGGVSSATGLYAITAVLNFLLNEMLSKLLLPAIYAYVALCISASVTEQSFLQKYADMIQLILSWLLKTLLYFFTGFLTITGVVSGAVDSSALKVTKLTIAGTMPVVGGILSDAAEAVLVSLGIMKNAAGVYGLLVILAIGIQPILCIGIEYLLLSLTAGVCELFGKSNVTELVHNLAGALGLVVSMTGTICILSLISTICFMRGISP